MKLNRSFRRLFLVFVSAMSVTDPVVLAGCCDPGICAITISATQYHAGFCLPDQLRIHIITTTRCKAGDAEGCQFKVEWAMSSQTNPPLTSSGDFSFTQACGTNDLDHDRGDFGGLNLLMGTNKYNLAASVYGRILCDTEFERWSLKATDIIEREATW